MSASSDRPKITTFSGLRQRPTHEVDEAEDLGLIDYPGLVTIFGSSDWRHEVIQSEWAIKASPTISVTNQDDRCTFWVSGITVGSFIDVDADSDEKFRIDKYEPWYSVGMKNPPEIRNITTLDPRGIVDDLSYTTASADHVKECFKRFFEGDYQCLYELFRWV